jgi:hypothetical protein
MARAQNIRGYFIEPLWQSADRAKKQATDDKLKFNLFVDTSGTIRDVKADPDYRYRPDPSAALAVAKSLGLRNP